MSQSTTPEQLALFPSEEIERNDRQMHARMWNSPDPGAMNLIASRLHHGQDISAPPDVEKTLAHTEESVKAYGSPLTSTRGNVTINGNQRSGFIVDALLGAAEATRLVRQGGFSARLDVPMGGRGAPEEERPFHPYATPTTPDVYAVARPESPTTGERLPTRIISDARPIDMLRDMQHVRAAGYDPSGRVYHGGWEEEGKSELDASTMREEPREAIDLGNKLGEKGVEAMKHGGTLRLDPTSSSGLDESDEFTKSWADQNRHRI